MRFTDDESPLHSPVTISRMCCDDVFVLEEDQHQTLVVVCIIVVLCEITLYMATFRKSGKSLQ